MRAKDATAPAPPPLPPAASPEPIGLAHIAAIPALEPVSTGAAAAPQDAAPAGLTWRPLSKPSPVKPGGTTVLGLLTKAALAAQGAHAPKATLAAQGAHAPQRVGPEVPTVDGVQFVGAVLQEIRRIKRDQPHIRPVVVFDLDNTIFETRTRTLAALHAYDAAHGTSHFAKLELADVGKDGAATAASLGTLDDAQIAEVKAFWLDWFWQGAHFMEDRVITRVEKLAHEASRAGAEVVYLTGRVNSEATLAQLRAAGLPDADAEHLVCKPAIGANTGNFKGEWLVERLEDPNVFLGWFLTEGRRDIATVQQHDARIPCVRLGYVNEREGHAVNPDTPLIPEAWTDRLRKLPKVADGA